MSLPSPQAPVSLHEEVVVVSTEYEEKEEPPFAYILVQKVDGSVIVKKSYALVYQ